MPPFLGQGMCSGIRDARNLAFKLDLVLRDAADPSILDTYQSEREPHVRTVTETGVRLGLRHTLRDPAAAAERDQAMRQARDSGTAPVKLLLPDLGPGLLSSRPALGTGQLSAHGIVAFDGRRGLLDDVLGGGFSLLATPEAARALAVDGLEKRLRDAGVRVVELVPDGDGASSGIRVTDIGGTYRRWFAELGATAVIVRPDFYVYGAVAEAVATPDLARELLRSIGRSRR